MVIFFCTNVKAFVFTNTSLDKLDYFGRCRWSTLSGEPLLFIKYDDGKLNIIDTEKKGLILKDSVQLKGSELRSTHIHLYCFSYTLINFSTKHYY